MGGGWVARTSFVCLHDSENKKHIEEVGHNANPENHSYREAV